MLGQALAQEFGDEIVAAWDKKELDITNKQEVADKIGQLKPEVIINAAAYTAVDDSEKNREVAFTVNAEAVGNIAAAAAVVDATVVHYSTDYVFAGDNPSGYREDDQPGPPVNVYGESKLAGEQALQQSGTRFYLIRTAWLYGSGGKNFVDTMLRLGQEKPALRVIYDQYGSPTYTRDLAAATHVLLQNYDPGIYHCTNSGTTTWHEFAMEIFKAARMPVTVQPIPSIEYPVPAKRPAYSVLLNTKGPPLRDWREALKEYIKEKTNE